MVEVIAHHRIHEPLAQRATGVRIQQFDQFPHAPLGGFRMQEHYDGVFSAMISLPRNEPRLDILAPHGVFRCDPLWIETSAPRAIGYREAMPDGTIPFDAKRPDLEAVRQIVVERLRRDASWNHLDSTGEGFVPYVEYVARNEPERQNGRSQFLILAQEVYWQLLVEGILAPGRSSSDLDLPNFHITAHGREVLASSEPQPYDPTGYLARLRERVPNLDPTVVAYLAESLETFRKANLVASTVMLGIAAERVFLLLCDSLAAALSNTSEKAAFTKLLDRFPMKPKLDWVQNKIQHIQKQAPPGFPENASIMLVAIYDLMRTQRNELGHPREAPPAVPRQDAFVNLQIFPRYYEIAEEVRTFLGSNPV
jgi:hypothetical protein